VTVSKTRMGQTRYTKFMTLPIQVLLGHAKLETTTIYTKVATKTIQSVTSPLDLLKRREAGPG